MTVYLGKLGQLIPIKCPSAQSVGADDGMTFERTLEGRIRAQVVPINRRSWSVRIGAGTPADLANVLAFNTGEFGIGPFVWVSADAPVTNMLTPGVSVCGPNAVVSAASSVGGPLALTDGTVAGRSLRNSNTAANMPFGRSITPVIPGVPVTGSAYVLGAGAKVGLAFYDSAGAWISAALSAGAGSAGVAVRLAVTATPPSNAVSCSVYAVGATAGARPAITWTPEVFDWQPGEGCAKAVITGLSKDIIMALRTPGAGRYSSASFTITEVG